MREGRHQVSDPILVGTAVVFLGTLVFIAVMAYLGRPRDDQ